jgi:hypothetical protein
VFDTSLPPSSFDEARAGAGVGAAAQDVRTSAPSVEAVAVGMFPSWTGERATKGTRRGGWWGWGDGMNMHTSTHARTE